MSFMEEKTMSPLELTEKECAEGRNAPRVSLDDINANIAFENTFIAAHAVSSLKAIEVLEGKSMISQTPKFHEAPASLDVLAICLIVTRNGFTIIGKSAPASPENFDADLGTRLAREDAIRQLWPLMGYELRERLSRGEAQPTPVVACPPDMSRYVGTKIVDAKPMTREAYCDFRGWAVPVDEDPNTAGYMVQYTDKQQNNVEGYEGYITWSPADVFEGAYRPL